MADPALELAELFAEWIPLGLTAEQWLPVFQPYADALALIDTFLAPPLAPTLEQWTTAMGRLTMQPDDVGTPVWDGMVAQYGTPFRSTVADVDWSKAFEQWRST